MSTELTVHQGGGEVVTRAYLHERRELIRSQLAREATDPELELFLEVSAARGLNPVTRQIYAIHRKNNKTGKMEMSIQTGIDGFRLIAQRTGEYRGQVAPQWCGRDGQWRDVWLEDEPPAAARVGVLRAGWSEPVYAVALWREYADTYQDGNPKGMWKNMPANQLAKCAESLALRKAFPEELSGIYSDDEMSQAGPASGAAQTPGDDTERVVRERYSDVFAQGAPEGESELERKARWKAIGEALTAAGYSREDLADDSKHAAAMRVAERAAREHAEQRAANANDAVRQFGGATGEVINADQMKLLHAKGRELGLNHDQLHQIAADTFDGIESMTEIPADGMDRMLEAMDAEGAAA